MAGEKKYFAAPDGGMNSDDAPFAIKVNEWTNAENVRTGTTDAGETGIVESIGSTILLPNPFLPLGQNFPLTGQGIEDEANSRIINFNFNSAGDHGIYVYDTVAVQWYVCLLNAQVAGGLNFDKYHLIQGRVINGNIYWNDYLNQPRRMNIDAGIQMNLTLANVASTGLIPNTSMLSVSNIDPNNGTFKDASFLVFTFVVPLNPIVSYATNQLTFSVIVTGSDGRKVIINMGLNHPGANVGPAELFDESIVTVFPTYGTFGTEWDIYAFNTTLTLYIKNTWDWGTGDGSFAPTNSVNILVNSWINPDGTTPNPYVSPLTQSVIAWARRQPGLPPTQTKVLITPAPQNIFIGSEAFLFCWRLQYRDYELSKLSAYSTLADFNEADPPPTITSLNVTSPSLVTRGYLATTYDLPTSPTPAYGPGILAKITRVGTGGSNAGALDINIPLDWTGYPGTKSYTRIIVEGINNYFKDLPGSDNPGVLSAGNYPATVGPDTYKWYISYRTPTLPCLNILGTWDWGLGDPSFPPTTEAALTLYQAVPAPSKQYTYIDISIPLGEQIDQDVIQVDLVAIFLISNVYYIVKSWRAGVQNDLLAILAHNSGTIPLSYSFYNNKAGVALSSAYSQVPFDLIPWLTKTFEMAKYRAFISNYKLGYNSIDLITSLTITPILTIVGAPITGNITGEWWLFQFFNSPRTTVYREYIIKTTSPVTPQPFSPYYYYTVAGAAPVLPTIISTGLIFLGTSFADVMQYYINKAGDISPGNYGSVIDQGVSVSLVSSNQTLNFGVLAKAFKANAPYQTCTMFYDNNGAYCGAITNDGLLFSTPNTGFSNNQYVTGVQWNLSNQNALTEIPLFAFYFGIGLTKCLRTRFFVEGIGFVTYADRDDSNNYTFNETSYSPNQAGVAVNISFLANNSMGYVFSQGDICNFYLAGVNYSLAVLGQQAQYIICQLQDVGQLGAASLSQFEIFTPYQQEANEPFYEVGQKFVISNPGTSNRQYSILQGVLAGDIFLFQRQNSYISYVAEAMSSNDKFYKLWYTDAGRSNVLDYIGEVDQSNSITYSETLILGSKVNGLSTFDGLDIQTVPSECGEINALQLTSKTQEQEGAVMLAICEDETASLYLSESQLLSANNTADLAISNTVIGTINVLKGSFGTINPEGVCEFKGNVFFPDAKNGKIIQYSSNGLFPISNYKMTRFWKLFFNQYLSMTPEEISLLGSRPFIYTAVDPHNWELLITIPKLLQNPPKGYLPDYPRQSIPYTTQDFTNGATGFTGMEVYSFIMPLNPPLPYSNLTQTAYLQVGGSDGKIITIQLSPNWNSYPAKTPSQIMVDALVSFMASSHAIVGVDFNVFATQTTVGLYVGYGYNWNTGDLNFAPTTFVNLFLQPIFDYDGNIQREIIYPFDIYDGQAKTLVFKLNADPNHWQGAYNHTSEGLVVVNNLVYGFKFGQLFQHNSISNYLINIYGVICKARIMFVSNSSPNRPKIYRAQSVEGNMKPSLSYFRTEPTLAEFDEYDLVEQASDLVDFDFKVKEGQLYATLYRNKIVPTAYGVEFTGLLTQEVIRALTLLCLLEFIPPTKTPLGLRYTTLEIEESIGHRT